MPLASTSASQRSGSSWPSRLGVFKDALDWLQLLARPEPPFLKQQGSEPHQHRCREQGLQTMKAMEFVARPLRDFAVPLVIPISRRKAVDREDQLVDDGVEDSRHPP